MSKRSIILLRGTAVAALLALPAMAQETVLLEEIVVTANRRAESVQDAPAAISALTASALEEKSITAVEGIAALVPGVQIATYQGDTSIFIRGIGTPTIIAGTDSSTATYIDGVYISRAAAIGPAFFDIDRIEVLRGPQGTLYGRNATSGAVSIITKGPTDSLEAEGRLILGNYNRIQANGAVSGPLSDRIRARLAVQAENHDGYAKVVRPRGTLPPTQPDITQDVGDKDDVSVRLKLEADLSETATLGLSADYYNADDRSNVYYFASAGYGEEIPGWYATREGSQTLPYFAIKNSGRVTAPKSRTLYADTPYFNKSEVWGLASDLKWDIGDHVLAVNASYRATNPVSQNEFDLSDSFNNYVGRAEDHWQASGDVQLSSPTGQRLSWIAGASWFKEDNRIDNNIFGDFWEPILVGGLTDLQRAGVIPTFPINLPQTNLCCELHLSGRQKTQALAGYVDATLEVSDRLRLRAGARYSHEKRDGDQRFELVTLTGVRLAPDPRLFPGSVSTGRTGVQPDPFGFVVAPVDGPARFSAFTPKAGIDYALNDDVLLYATVQRGFKSGGYNIGSSQREPFQPEKIWSYEAGAKTELMDRRLRLNGALFNYDYTNLQAQDSIGNQPIIRNVGETAVHGAEIEGVLSLTDNWRMDGAVTWLDAKFTKGELTEPLRPAPLTQAPGSSVRDLDGLRLPRAPEWKTQAGLQYTRPLDGAGTVTARVDYAWQSKIYFTVFNIDAASEAAYGLLKARLGWTSEDRRWSVAAFADNITNERYFTNQILTGTVYGAEFVGSMGPPRLYGIDIGFRF